MISLYRNPQRPLANNVSEPKILSLQKVTLPRGYGGNGRNNVTRWLDLRGSETRQNSRCDRVPDQPGAEMQHDTSPYRLPLGDQRVQVIASLLYLRYASVATCAFIGYSTASV